MTRMRRISDTTSSGGFPNAPAYCRNCANAASRSRCGFFLFPGKVLFVPHVSESAMTGVLVGLLLKGIEFPLRIGLSWHGNLQEPAEFDEMRLRGGALGQ